MRTKNYFETIKCEDEDIFNLHFHKQRVSRTIGINLNLEEYIYPTSNKLLKCKVIYNQAGIVDIEYTPYLKKNINSFKLVYDDNIIYEYKSTNRESIEKLSNQKENCDEIIIVKNGLITDTSIANISVKIDNIWYTPKHPLLQGTTLHRLLENRTLKQKNITVSELLDSQQIAVMNAMVGFDILDIDYDNIN